LLQDEEEDKLAKSRKKTKSPKVYPTNERYNKKVPSMSYRIDPDTKKTLSEIHDSSNGETWAKVFRRLVGDYEFKLISIEEARKNGFELGLRNAKLWYGVSYPCAKCGQTIFVSGPRQIAQVRELIVKARLAHSQCPEPNLPQPTPPKPTPSSITLPKSNPPVMLVHRSNGSQDKILRFLQSSEGANGAKSLP
jgi:hypothetical protein